MSPLFPSAWRRPADAGNCTNPEQPVGLGKPVLAYLPIGLIIWILFLCLCCGCAAHYHRTDENGMTLYLRLPKAEKVILFSSLDGFSPYPAKRNNGKWENALPADREFRYFYTVDGQIFIPACPLKEKDDFGLENCIYLPGL